MRAFECSGWNANMWSELAGSSESLLEVAGTGTFACTASPEAAAA